ncbi:MAG: cytochrome c biogenesis protein ResB [Bacteriovoracaceae bacterium]|nr:cytochrome c biogenesis protein ResB [Bacteriovoracaceae bacterium]
MKKLTLFFDRFDEIVSSSKFVVSLLVVATVYFSAATVVESVYGARFAAGIFYQSWGMAVLAFSSVLSIFFAMMKRFTTSKKNIAFQVMHWGILVVFAGSFFTYDAGLDGVLSVYPNASNNKISFNQRVIKLFPQNDMLETVEIELPNVIFSTSVNKSFKGVSFEEYYPFAREALTWVSANDGASGYFELTQKNEVIAPLVFSHSQSSRFRHEAEIGPLKIYFLPESYSDYFSKYDWGKKVECFDITSENPIPLPKNKVKKARRSCFDKRSLTSSPSVFIFGDKIFLYSRKHNRIMKHHSLSNGTTELPWMDLSLVPLKLSTSEYPTLSPIAALPSPKSKEGEIFSTVSMRFGKEIYWLKQGSEEVLKLGKELYSVSLGRKEYTLPFQIYLKKFEIQKDEDGSPASYQSEIEVYDNRGEKSSHIISMNQPLTVGKFTLYQNSYFQLQNGEYASTLSVNYDPGRFYKYLGSLMLIIGGLLYYLFAIRLNSEFKDD